MQTLGCSPQHLCLRTSVRGLSGSFPLAGIELHHRVCKLSTDQGPWGGKPALWHESRQGPPRYSSRDLRARASPSGASPTRQRRRKEPQVFQGLQFYATCHPGLESVVANELMDPAVGALSVEPGKAGVTFRGADISTGYRANLWLRSAIRVLVLLAEEQLDSRWRGGDELYRFGRQAVDWPRLLLPEQSFQVEARVRSCTDIPSSLLVQARLRDAICDAMRDAGLPRPSPPEEGRRPELPLFAALFRDHISLYRDMSGESLHRRGYRQVMHRASLNESAAAGALQLADWPRLAAQGATLADPMCGSGTFLIEAGLMARNIAPGLSRSAWPFQTWPDHDGAAWAGAVTSAQAAERPWAGRLLGNDIHAGAVALAQRDADAAGVGDLLDLTCGPCRSWQPPVTPSLVVVNPPWGQRLTGVESSSYDVHTREAQRRYGYKPFNGRPPNARQEVPVDDRQKKKKKKKPTAADSPPPGGLNESPLPFLTPHDDPDGIGPIWQELGLFLKEQCRNAEVFVLSGNRDITRELRMKRDCQFPITIGGVDTRLIKYTVLPPKAAEDEAAWETLPM